VHPEHTTPPQHTRIELQGNGPDSRGGRNARIKHSPWNGKLGDRRGSDDGAARASRCTHAASVSQARQQQQQQRRRRERARVSSKRAVGLRLPRRGSRSRSHPQRCGPHSPHQIPGKATRPDDTKRANGSPPPGFIPLASRHVAGPREPGPGYRL
jgi:hypothetical protein